MSVWHEWVHRPETVPLRRALFHLHLWVGLGVGLYIALMSITGSLLVFRNQLEKVRSIVPIVEWIVNLHGNLLLGETGRFLNGFGALAVTLLCCTGAVIWWPGIEDWRRALTVQTVNPRAFFARFTWDLHSAVGFWSFLFVLMWGISGLDFCFPQAANALSRFVDPRDKYADRMWNSISLFHFGRFTWYTEAVWLFLGLVPAVLSATGVFLCCRRMIHKIPPARP